MSNLLCRRSGVSGQLLLTRHARILVNACLTQKSLPKFVGEKNVTYEFAPPFFWPNPLDEFGVPLQSVLFQAFAHLFVRPSRQRVGEACVAVSPSHLHERLSCEIDLFMARSQAR